MLISFRKRKKEKNREGKAKRTSKSPPKINHSKKEEKWPFAPVFTRLGNWPVILPRSIKGGGVDERLTEEARIFMVGVEIHVLLSKNGVDRDWDNFLLEKLKLLGNNITRSDLITRFWGMFVHPQKCFMVELCNFLISNVFTQLNKTNSIAHMKAHEINIYDQLVVSAGIIINFPRNNPITQSTLQLFLKGQAEKEPNFVLLLRSYLSKQQDAWQTWKEFQTHTQNIFTLPRLLNGLIRRILESEKRYIEAEYSYKTLNNGSAKGNVKKQKVQDFRRYNPLTTFTHGSKYDKKAANEAKTNAQFQLCSACTELLPKN